MQKRKIRSATVADFQQLSHLIAEQNSKPESQCIHSGENAVAINKEMVSFVADDEFVIVLAEEDGNGRIIGAFGAEYDTKENRAWLWGPFALDDNDYQLTNALYQKLQHDLPPDIKYLRSYLNDANQWGLAYYEQAGFVTYATAHVYTAQKSKTPLIPDDNCVLLPPALETQFAALLDEIFPNAHTKGAAIVKKLEKDKNHAYIIHDEQTLVGFIYAFVDKSSGEGYIDYVGVQEAARGRGLGRRLLRSALAWLFNEQHVPQVSLNVRDDLVNARSLYESLGFRLIFTGAAMDKSLGIKE